MTDSPTPLRLIAYRLHRDDPMPIVPAARQRDWMDKTAQKFAYRCLPLLIANQAGWHILNTHAVKLTWTGKQATQAVTVEYLEQPVQHRVMSHFGYGIVTWALPFLFRTPPGYNLLARGPANYPKDGIYPLEGVIETDWSTATFTMNWQMTRPNHPIIFEKDEPICLIVPQKRGELETFNPVISDIQSNPDLEKKFRQWRSGRHTSQKQFEAIDPRSTKKPWQQEYFMGNLPDNPAQEHQMRLEIREFVEENTPRDNKQDNKIDI